MIQLSHRGMRPIYGQIRSDLCYLVVTGVLQAEGKLPFVWALASSPAIDPSTIRWAYESLEQEGYLYTVAGKSSFATLRADVNTAKKDRLLRRFDASAAELLFPGMTTGELAGRLEAAAWQTVREECSYD